MSLIPSTQESEFKLDTFQEESVDKINKNENIIVNSPTGSGKTYCAIYAIQYNLKKHPDKKIIYTSPIKALSNQKFYEFSNKFGKENIGLITGDIKYGVNNRILIMTAEILRDLIYNNSKYKETLDLTIDINNDVSCVIMDEIHYINDPYRGNVWEETLMLLQPHINLILLSATVKNACYLAKWLTIIKKTPCHLITKRERPIPLKTYLYYYFTNFSSVKNNNERNYLSTYSNKLLDFHSEHFRICKNYTKKYKRKFKYSQQIASIENLLNNLKSKNMLPALCFIFSRKRTEEYAYKLSRRLNSIEEANEIEKYLNDFLVKIKKKSPKIKYILETIDSHKFEDLSNLWKKGIAYHHSGLQIIYRELVEILCNKGFIKILFATETFAMGINAPFKTVIFTDLQKYSNYQKFRFLNKQEYAQMSGRAGRRGIDTYGSIVILTNFMKIPSEYYLTKLIKNVNNSGNLGTQSYINSRFRFTYQLVLKIINGQLSNFKTFTDSTFKSMQLFEQHNTVNNLNQTEYDINIHHQYYDTKQKIYTNNVLYPNDSSYLSYCENLDNFEEDHERYTYNYKEIQKLQRKEWEYQKTCDHELNKMIYFLINNKYIQLGQVVNYQKTYTLTTKGLIAANIHEINEILMTEIFVSDKNIFETLNVEEICGMLSIFLNTKAINDCQHVYPENIQQLNISENLKNMLYHIIEINDKHEEEEYSYQLNGVNTNWILNFDMVECVYHWAKGIDMDELRINYRLYIGTFVKDILRLDNIIETLELVSKIIGKNNVYVKLFAIHPKIVREIVINDSLYLTRI